MQARFVAILASAPFALIVATAGPAAASWELRKGGDSESCWIESAAHKIDTGYNEAEVRILVDKSRIVLRSDAKLDDAFGDLAVKVDRRAGSAIDRVEKERSAVLESDYEVLVKDFMAGMRVAVTLRFWPTWPSTGPRSAKFSLLGFSKAYKALADC